MSCYDEHKKHEREVFDAKQEVLDYLQQSLWRHGFNTDTLHIVLFETTDFRDKFNHVWELIRK